ncbi:MAG: hypothetical protein ACI9NY_001345 [Kiritimatiellia bacterium]|jgi:hypothetical protein
MRLDGDQRQVYSVNLEVVAGTKSWTREVYFKPHSLYLARPTQQKTHSDDYHFE